MSKTKGGGTGISIDLGGNIPPVGGPPTYGGKRTFFKDFSEAANRRFQQSVVPN